MAPWGHFQGVFYTKWSYHCMTWSYPYPVLYHNTICTVLSNNIIISYGTMSSFPPKWWYHETISNKVLISIAGWMVRGWWEAVDRQDQRSPSHHGHSWYIIYIIYINRKNGLLYISIKDGSFCVTFPETYIHNIEVSFGFGIRVGLSFIPLHKRHIFWKTVIQKTTKVLIHTFTKWAPQDINVLSHLFDEIFW